MTRTLYAITLTFALAPAASGQDMPLSQILLDGEGWKKVQKPYPPAFSAPVLTQ